MGNTSRDQYMGVIFGLGVAYDMVNDAGVRASIQQIADRLVGFLKGHAWTVAMPDGSVSTTFVIRPDEILTLLQVGRHVNPNAFQTDYDINRILLAAGVLTAVAVDAASDSFVFQVQPGLHFLLQSDPAGVEGRRNRFTRPRTACCEAPRAAIRTRCST